MTVTSGPLLGLGASALALTLGTGLRGPDDGVVNIEFVPKAQQKWTFILPKETWSKLGQDIGIPHGDRSGYATETRGMLKLGVDIDGDGRFDKELNGVKGFLTLTSKDDAGKDFPYSVRFVNDGDGWKYSTAMSMSGTFKNRTIQVIDQNNNGSFNEYGTDAMIVGPGDAACYLSRVISIDDQLYSFEISRDGREAKASPYTGEAGTINATKSFKSNGKLLAAVIRKGDVSFNVAASSDGMVVPEGDYELVSGYTTRATESVWIRTGKMRAIEVKAKEEKDIEWGAPVVADFDYTISGETITVPPDVHFYGSAGEEYHTFKPDAKSPKIIVVDKLTRKEVASGRFGGC